MAGLRGRGVPLRVGLVAATLVLVACGLLASGIAVTSILRHSLINRVDQTLLDASRGWAQAPRRLPRRRWRAPTRRRPPSDFYVRGIDPDGRIWMAVNDRAAEPALPADNDVGPVPVTVGSIDNSHVQWRAMSVRGPHGELTTVAIDLSDVQSTVRALIWSQVGIGAAVLLVLGVAGFAVVHRSLRPLAEVEQTAAAIAAGQLDRRVPQRDPRTEVGRLSLALNGMLAQIQRAVASSESSAEQARTSEERMRRFITDASHELRTPLTTIRGFAELYRQGAARDVEMLMSRIESESRRMGLLVEDLLLLARLDAQRPLERHRVDLLALASDAVHDAQVDRPEAQDPYGGLRRPRHARGARRRGPTAAGAGQPGGQRAAAHPGHRGHHRAGGNRRRHSGSRSVRRRSRHEQPGRAPRVRAVLPHRLLAGAGQRWHRAGAVDRRLAGLRARRDGKRHHRAGRGCRFTVNLPRIADVAAQVSST